MGPSAPKVPAGTMIEPGKSMEALLNIYEEEIVGAAKAMPAEKYSFAPSAGDLCAFAEGGLRVTKEREHIWADSGAYSAGELLLLQQPGRNEARCGCEGDGRSDFEGRYREGA